MTYTRREFIKTSAVVGAVAGISEFAALPPGVAVTVTRDYGEKANDAVNELIQRLVEAIAIVVVLLLVLGWRQALVVATAPRGGLAASAGAAGSG